MLCTPKNRDHLHGENGLHKPCEKPWTPWSQEYLRKSIMGINAANCIVYNWNCFAKSFESCETLLVEVAFVGNLGICIASTTSFPVTLLAKGSQTGTQSLQNVQRRCAVILTPSRKYAIS